MDIEIRGRTADVFFCGESNSQRQRVESALGEVSSGPVIRVYETGGGSLSARLADYADPAISTALIYEALSEPEPVDNAV